MKTSVIAGMAVAVVLAGAAHAADPRHPDWPCHQIMVPSLSVSAFWTGPAIDAVGDAWRKDQTVNDLVLRLAARRTPLDAAEKAAQAFVAGSPDGRKERATLLFAGLFARLNEERSQVMNGIQRFSHRQQELRTKIQAELTTLRGIQDATEQNGTAGDKLGEQIAWDTRVFDERRHTIGYVCEVPATIERRLFALARAIQQALNQH